MSSSPTEYVSIIGKCVLKRLFFLNLTKNWIVSDTKKSTAPRAVTMVAGPGLLANLSMAKQFIAPFISR